MSDPSPPPVALVVSRYHGLVTERLCEGARRVYASQNRDESTLGIIDAPGAFELTALCLHAARSGLYAGIVALGCIVRGETNHDRVLADAVAQGLTAVTLQTGVPVALGVLTVDNDAQALARAGGDQGNKGEEAMNALLDTLRACRAIDAAARAGTPSPVQSTIFRTIAGLGGHSRSGA
ncbi:MAG: 6,7-dimethyl-8-ribityllumazine synthase [Phycisphaeraceae bacterium]|nr:6,7-dimethyl-8-ribityllumazine synthase [Phycisphaeraceae bacterium]